MKTPLKIIPLALQRAICEGDMYQITNGRSAGHFGIAKKIDTVTSNETAQQVLLCSDEEIKEGNWYYILTQNRIEYCPILGYEVDQTDIKKIIASSIPIEGIPTISKEDLQRICEVLNKGCDTIYVEYEYIDNCATCETFNDCFDNNKGQNCNKQIEYPVIKDGNIVLVWEEEKNICPIYYCNRCRKDTKHYLYANISEKQYACHICETIFVWKEKIKDCLYEKCVKFGICQRFHICVEAQPKDHVKPQASNDTMIKIDGSAFPNPPQLQKNFKICTLCKNDSLCFGIDKEKTEGYHCSNFTLIVQSQASNDSVDRERVMNEFSAFLTKSEYFGDKMRGLIYDEISKFLKQENK